MPFISLYDMFLEYCDQNGIFYEDMLTDGVHPNDRGYEAMYELLKKALKI